MVTITMSTTHMPFSYDNETGDYYRYNMFYYNDSEMYNDLKRRAAELGTIDDERHFFSYVYHAFAGCIVVFNLLTAISILMSKKQRRHIRSWLILHMTFLHILYGAVGLPFLGQMMNTTAAGLERNMAICKLLYFLSDVLQYMSNLSIGMLGVYQAMNVISPRLLKSVSNVLLVSIMMILPWLVVVMLTAVLRLTMSEEQYGRCYIVSDRTADILWFVLSLYLPLALVIACFIAILIITFSKSKPKQSPSQSNHRSGVTIFVIICLGATIFMRLPFYVLFFKPVRHDCEMQHGALVCTRLLHGLDVARMASLVVIPLAYLIPREIGKRCRMLKSKLLCRSVDCSTNTTTKKQQNIELKSVPTSERAV